MKTALTLFIYMVCLCTWCGCGKTAQKEAEKAQTAVRTSDLQKELADFVARNHAGDSLGICVYDLTADTLVYGYRDDVPMSVASCLKLLTGFTALRELGRGHEFHTTIEHAGPQHGDTLRGALVVRADIDPLLNDTDIVNAAKSIVEKNFTFVPDSIVLSFPEEDGLQSEEHWMPGDIKKQHRGVNAFPRAARTQHVLQSLSAGGINVARAKVVWQQNMGKGKVLEDIRHTLRQVLWAMWNHSSNVRSEGVLCALVLHNGSGKPFRAHGIEIMQRFLREAVPDYAAEATIHDGCGLCPENRMSARLLCALLRYGWHTPSARRELFRDLPVSGIRGTLVREMKEGAIKGRVMAKTGTLTRNGGITSLAGYCKGRDGHALAFVVISAPSPVADAHRLRGHLCEILTGVSRK